MLDSETRARIDAARDILVGKVPDPKSQVEQITIALIYKFMDDMDRQSEELGGRATFFAGEFKKYAWANLLDKRLSGHERLLLYAEGIEKLNENRNIPQLFRDIFRGVFLPYRDPETLNLFLKEINGFSYDHSERLGDAFEYLLSILGSQGEAGQFRTPRHIIDFIVAVVDPHKNETVLDPACGTAGFLISAYKHILAQNAEQRPGDRLTGDERARLMGNFCGYDISPDMVRLSRANLYLHGFADPRIHEYDTLTSVERWDERYDVIMANPPFMTPKGGIRPHNKFSIKATRSEVLFVDYIAEHLAPGGRGGVIVPEGIIFQGQNAYKALRRLLVQEYLWAVVSLPGGVFNPYSGVKTSILFLDKRLARQRDEVLFVKVGADGFDLGAQRRPIDRNDLPAALAALAAYRDGDVEEGEGWDGEGAGGETPPLRVARQRLLENPECSLSGERYRDNGAPAGAKWPTVRLGEVAEIISGQSPPGNYYNGSGEGLPFYQGKADFGETHLLSPRVWTTQVIKRAHINDVLMSVRAPVGPVNLNPFREICIGRGLAAIRAGSKLNYSLLFYMLRHLEDQIRRLCAGSTFESINRKDIAEIEIPLPPLAEQERIVAELEGYRKVVEGARQVVANYRPQIAVNVNWPRYPLSEICSLEYGLTASGKEQGDARLVRITDITEAGLLSMADKKYITLDEKSRLYLLREGDILVARTGATYGKTLLFAEKESAVFASFLIRLRFSDQILPAYYWMFAQSDDYWQQARALVSGGGQPQFNGNALRRVVLPVPPLDIQCQMIVELEAERALIDPNRKLIDLFERKIRARLDEIWGEPETAEEMPELRAGEVASEGAAYVQQALPLDGVG